MFFLYILIIQGAKSFLGLNVELDGQSIYVVLSTGITAMKRCPNVLNIRVFIPSLIASLLSSLYHYDLFSHNLRKSLCIPELLPVFQQFQGLGGVRYVITVVCLS